MHACTRVSLAVYPSVNLATHTGKVHERYLGGAIGGVGSGGVHGGLVARLKRERAGGVATSSVAMQYYSSQVYECLSRR